MSDFIQEIKNNRFMRPKNVDGNLIVFHPFRFYESVPKEEHKYIDEYLSCLIDNQTTLSLSSINGINDRTREHLEYRLKHKDLFKAIQTMYAKFVYDDAILKDVSINSPLGKDFRESDVPIDFVGRLKEKVALPLEDDYREKLMSIPKKAIYPTQKLIVDQTKEVRSTWLVGKLNNQVILFRLHEEICKIQKKTKNEHYKNANSGLSLEVFPRGRHFGGKYLVREDFKPFKGHQNLFSSNGSIACCGYFPVVNTKLRYNNFYPDHTHKYTLNSDLVLPKHTSTDITINTEEPREYETFKKNFISKYGLDMSPLLDCQNTERNYSIEALANLHFNNKDKDKADTTQNVNKTNNNTDNRGR